MKTYSEQRYPVSIKVRVTYEGPYGHSFTDEIKGLNTGHALYRAGLNWERATTIERIS